MPAFREGVASCYGGSGSWNRACGVVWRLRTFLMGKVENVIKVFVEIALGLVPCGG